ncbi:hypothetical protein [uncultured Tenacibaculum sp.]|uniref:hypothetical protein n=1 Tax=uncultured Tenacibaculum sp. TaxID=174713 RepID=UPI00261492B4|nr:hypothetical protein [uncultured Tenacibaculum sp.]
MTNLKLITSCLFVFLMLSCSSDDTIVNNPPIEFSITFGRVDNNGLLPITWTEAIDPDGDTVTYNVFADDVLKESNLKERKATIALINTKNIKITVVAKDSKGAETEVVKIYRD